MHRPTLLTLATGLALWTALGCGSSSDPASPVDTTPAVCEAPGYASEAESVTLQQVKAAVFLPSGDAAAQLPVQVCGLDVCLPYTANGAGVLDVAPRTPMKRPALKYGDGFDFAELAVPLGAEPKQDLGELIALPLPAFTEGSSFPKRGALTNGALTLQLADHGSFEHDILTYGDESERVFRSVAIPIAESSQALPPSFGFELAYGVAPLGTTFCPAAQLSLENSLAWAPGTAIEVFVQGLDVSEKWAPYGTWQLVAEASVSSDGKRIETTSGGIPILSSIALRRK